jgi:hypothetical protein
LICAARLAQCHILEVNRSLFALQERSQRMNGM